MPLDRRVTGRMHRQNPAAWFCLPFITAVTACIASLLSDAPMQAGSLFQCRDASGALTYTDSTAQLGHCVPVQSLPPAQIGHTPTPPTYIPHTEPQPYSNFMMPVQTEQLPVQTMTMTSPNLYTVEIPPERGTAIAPPEEETRPCHPGLTPFNPLSAPPCPPLPPNQSTRPPVFPNDIQASDP